MSAAVGRSAAGPDLITGYLDQMHAGLRVPAAEAELILAEAEDHLRETAAAGLAIGMTEQEAQEAAISVFGPVRAVVRAHHARRGWRRRGRGMLLGGFFPMVAAGFFGAIALALTTLSAGGVGVPVPGGLAPRPGLVAADYPPSRSTWPSPPA